MEGSDWGGQDLAPANCDILTGTFTNIGRFIINAGDTVYSGSSLLSLTASEVIVYGTLRGDGYSQNPHITVQDGMTLGGSISVTGYLELTCVTSITLGQGAGITPGSGLVLSVGGSTISTGRFQDVVNNTNQPIVVNAANATVIFSSGIITITPNPSGYLPSILSLLLSDLE